MPTGIDPRFDDYKPQAEKDFCQCCQEAEAVETWMTKDGRKKICKYCLNFHKEETDYLIEKL